MRGSFRRLSHARRNDAVGAGGREALLWEGRAGPAPMDPVEMKEVAAPRAAAVESLT